jgi:hypothetical protein
MTPFPARSGLAGGFPKTTHRVAFAGSPADAGYIVRSFRRDVFGDRRPSIPPQTHCGLRRRSADREGDPARGPENRCASRFKHRRLDNATLDTLLDQGVQHYPCRGARPTASRARPRLSPAKTGTVHVPGLTASGIDTSKSVTYRPQPGKLPLLSSKIWSPPRDACRSGARHGIARRDPPGCASREAARNTGAGWRMGQPGVQLGDMADSRSETWLTPQVVVKLIFERRDPAHRVAADRTGDSS